MAYHILITGADGQLGRCLQDLAKRETSDENRFFFTDIDTLDICDKRQIENFVVQNRIHAIINAAAYTNVDKAEKDTEAAYRLNRDAVGNLADVAKQHQVYLIHISTDYVFSGKSWSPYKENHTLAPISIYGKSKAAGEKALMDSHCHATIIRTSWLYSEYGHNFVKTMLQLGQKKQELSVVCDQIGGPTYAGNLAEAIMTALKHNCHREGVQIYHFANEGIASWYDFTKAILEFAHIPCTVNPIFTSEYPAAAPRPPYSVFNLSKIKKELSMEIPYWKDSLKLTINKLLS